ncbi:hypothetical protein GOODEAATRI_008207, partial [Goodea atripinnis]
ASRQKLCRSVGLFGSFMWFLWVFLSLVNVNSAIIITYIRRHSLVLFLFRGKIFGLYIRPITAKRLKDRNRGHVLIMAAIR